VHIFANKQVKSSSFFLIENDSCDLGFKNFVSTKKARRIAPGLISKLMM